MATPILPTTSSIVDFLKTSGKDASFGSRKKIYNDLGFSSRLGEYQGSVSQNLNLLKRLKNSNPQPSAVDIVPPSATAVPKTGGETTAATLLNPPVASQPSPSLTPSVTTPSAPVANALNQMGFQKFGTPTTPAPVAPTTKEVAPAAPATPSPETTAAQSTDTQTKTKLGLSASDIYPDIFGDKGNTNEADLVNKWLNSAEGQSFLDRQNLTSSTAEAKAEAAKAELEGKYKADVTKLEENLAEKGLAFSGIRGTQVKALADSLASSTLKIDRETASKLLSSNIDLRDAVLKGVAEIAKAAQDGRKEAIQQLNAIGYAVVGNQLVPTLAATKADEASQRADEQLAISKARLAIAQKNAAGGTGGGNKLTLSEVKANKLPVSLVGKSENEIAQSFYDPNPPEWFIEKFLADSPVVDGITIKPPFSPLEQSYIAKAWQTESQSYIAGTTGDTNAAKASSYFKTEYPSLNADAVQKLVDATSNYINGGMSYATAVQQVVTDASK